jgi:hypothetical protein
METCTAPFVRIAMNTDYRQAIETTNESSDSRRPRRARFRLPRANRYSATQACGTQETLLSLERLQVIVLADWQLAENPLQLCTAVEKSAFYGLSPLLPNAVRAGTLAYMVVYLLTCC